MNYFVETGIAEFVYVKVRFTFMVIMTTKRTTATAPNTPHKMLTNGLGGPSFLKIITTFSLVTRIYRTNCYK